MLSTRRDELFWHQNSIRPRRAIILTDESPPNPEPKRPVTGDTVALMVPKLERVDSLLGIPANTGPPLGGAKFGWLKTLNNCISNLNPIRSLSLKRLPMLKSTQRKSGPRREFRPKLPSWQFCGEFVGKHWFVLESITD